MDKADLYDQERRSEAISRESTSEHPASSISVSNKSVDRRLSENSSTEGWELTESGTTGPAEDDKVMAVQENEEQEVTKLESFAQRPASSSPREGTESPFIVDDNQEDDDDDKADEGDSTRRSMRHRPSISQYMEEASMETVLDSQPQYLQSSSELDQAFLLPTTTAASSAPLKIRAAGRMGRRTTLSDDIVVVKGQEQQYDAEDKSMELTTVLDPQQDQSSSSVSSIHGSFQGQFQSAHDASNGNGASASNSTPMFSPGKASRRRILRTAQSPSMTVPEEEELSVLELLVEYKILPESTPTEDYAILLHLLLEGFSSPVVDLLTVQQVLELEQTRDYTTRSNIPFPDQPILIDPSRIIQLFSAGSMTQPAMLRFPVVFLSALFRILIRLLTYEPDVEYNTTCFLMHPIVDTSKPLIQVAEEGPNDPDFASRRPHLLYTFARFQYHWNQYCVDRLQTSHNLIKDDRPSLQVLWNLWDQAATSQGWETPHQANRLLAPLARFMGLLSVGGISPWLLRRMLAGCQSSGITNTARMSLLRAIRTAASGASRPLVMSRTPPRHFFSLSGRGGLQRTITGLSTWPFRNDFGMAVWFRMERFDASKQTLVLLSVRTDDGGGIEVSLVRLQQQMSDACTLAVSVYDSRQHAPVKSTTVQSCVLLPGAWYHLAVRHTRSRLKGVFSLSARQQLSIMLDGRLLLTESMAFPNISGVASDDSASSLLQASLAAGFQQTGLSGLRRASSSHSRLNIKIIFADAFHGQTGALYLFNDYVNDTSFSALYEATGGNSNMLKRSNSVDQTWDARRSEVVKRSRVLDVNITNDDADEIVLSNRRSFGSFRFPEDQKVSMLDIGEGDEEKELQLQSSLQKSQFGSRVFLTWDPRRTLEGMVIDLHVGAHLNLDYNDFSWLCNAAQDVISSLGGVQALVAVFHSLLVGCDEEKLISKVYIGDEGECPFCPLPDLFILLTSFLYEHHDNAREFLRCGGVDVLEQLIHGNRRMLSGKLFRAVECHENTSYRLIQSLLVLRVACTHYLGLETKVFTRLIFNIPLWLGGAPSMAEDGNTIEKFLLPVLSSIAKSVPDKVRDCIGTRDMVFRANELLEDCIILERDVRDSSMFLSLSFALDTVLGMIFNILSSGATVTLLSPFLTFLSDSLQRQKDALINIAGTQTVTKSQEFRKQWNAKGSAVLYFLMQVRPPVPGFLESFLECCGSVQGCVGWILAALVDSDDDVIRSFGIRSVAAYLSITSRNPDSLLSLGTTTTQVASPGSEQPEPVAQMRGLGLLAKGIAAMGPAARTAVVSASGITPKVVVTLLWRILKSRRSHLGESTWAALLCWMSDDNDTSISSISSLSYLQSQVITEGGWSSVGCIFNMENGSQLLAESRQIVGRSLADSLALTAVLRLLRFLDGNLQTQWISHILVLAKASRRSMGTLATLSDWQPVLFVIISDTLDVICHASKKRSLDTDRMNPCVSTNEDDSFDGQFDLGQDSIATEKRMEISLELYASLLGFMIREGGEKALDAVERTASLQRICVNGPHTLVVILSNLCVDLFDHGTLRDVCSMSAADWKDIDIEYESPLLKQCAKLVTDAILSNGAKGLDLTNAVRSWRSIRHYAEVVVAVITANGFGTVDLFDYANERGAVIDCVSGGLLGIRLPETRLEAIKSPHYLATIRAGGSHGRDATRRFCTELAAQMLVILDYFMFPDSFDDEFSSFKSHGLTLVRSSDSRLGTSQGPLVVSAVRLSLVLLSHLEPCSVRFLQAIGRLRSLLSFIYELLAEIDVKEANTVDSATPSVGSMLDLVLAVIIHCHRALGRCSSLLSEIESSSYELYFENKEFQRKVHRRLLRAAFELRDIVASAYQTRKELFMMNLSEEAADALCTSLEGSSASKESLVRDFLESPWVSGYQDVETRLGLIVPEQLCRSNIPIGSDADLLGKGVTAIDALVKASRAVVADFDRVMDIWFNEYLENQKRWTETGIVRELEAEGIRILTLVADMHNSDKDAAKSISTRRSGAENRWDRIQHKVVGPWTNETKWMLAPYTDRQGRRTLLMPNHNFTDHAEASYEQEIDLDRERKPKLFEKDFTDVVRRNADAFTSSEVISDTEQPESRSAFQQSDDEESSAYESDHTEPIMDDSDHDEEWEKIQPREIGGVDVEGDSDGWAKTFIWSDSEAAVARFEPVMLVSLRSYVEGTLLLTTHGVYFRQTGEEFGSITKEPDQNGSSTNRRWRLARLTEVHGRRYMLRPQALELFFSDSHELFLNFPTGYKERDRFYAKLRNSCKTPMLWSPKSLNPRTVFRKSRLMELWKKRQLSNFEYIMALNRMAGRSFNDITQYPVFPWVLTDFTSQEIDLSDPRVYRDLTKPIGALNPDRLAQLIERYNDLELFGFTEAEKFLYGSHYSSPGIVLHYLIRQEPFTTMAIELQSGRFDCPDRLFIDLADSWNSCLTSTSDMKELIPEFFSLPEMFLNTNKFPLGRTQGGRLVDHVTLPPWAKGSPYEFVRVHRLALESETVSQSLHHWIDLVFGYKQRGEEAMAAHNLFHHLSYEGSVDLDRIADEVDRRAAESHIQNFGQTPGQLLALEPHSSRYPVDLCWKPLIHDLTVPKRLRCYTPSKQFGNIRSEHAKGAVIQIHVQSESLLVVYGDLSVGRYRWIPKSKSTRLKMEKIHPMSRRELSASRTSIKRGSAISEEKMEASSRPIGNWSFAATIGGRAKELLRRTALLAPTNRLLASTETLANAESSCFVVSCGYWDDGVRVHSAETFRQLAFECGGHHGPVRCLAIGQDGGLMATGSQDGICCVWVIDHPDMSVALSDGYVQTVLGASNDGDKILSCCHVLWGHETPVTCVALDSDLDAVVSGSQAGLICIHTIRKGEYVRSFCPPSLAEGKQAGDVFRVAVHSTGTLVAHMGDSGLHTYTINGVRICSADAGEKLNEVKLCSSGEILVTGGARCRVVIRTVCDLAECASLDLSRHGPICCIGLTPADLNPTPQTLFIGSDDGMITIVDEDLEQHTNASTRKPPGGITFRTA